MGTLEGGSVLPNSVGRFEGMSVDPSSVGTFEGGSVLPPLEWLALWEDSMVVLYFHHSKVHS